MIHFGKLMYFHVCHVVSWEPLATTLYQFLISRSEEYLSCLFSTSSLPLYPILTYSILLSLSFATVLHVLLAITYTEIYVFCSHSTSLLLIMKMSQMKVGGLSRYPGWARGSLLCFLN